MATQIVADLIYWKHSALTVTWGGHRFGNAFAQEQNGFRVHFSGSYGLYIGTKQYGTINECDKQGSIRICIPYPAGGQ